MADIDNRGPVDYASSNSSAAGAVHTKTAPIPSYQSAAAANAKAAAVAHSPSHSSGTPVAAKKASSVYRTPGIPTAMRVHRGQQDHRPIPTPVPSSKPEESKVPPRTTWTAHGSVASSTMSSVARRRGSVAQDPSRAPAARAGSESLPRPLTQSSVHRRREVSQMSSVNVPQSVERRRGSVHQLFAPAGSEGCTTRAVSEPAAVPPFQLLSAGRPVPELPRELEDAVTAYYMNQLRQLSIADQERIVYSMVAPRDVKAVMTCLKQQEQAGAAAAGSAIATPVRLRGHGVSGHPVPKNALHDPVVGSSRRRVLQKYHNEYRPSPQQRGFTPEQAAAMARFRQHFTVEACAAFLDDALDVCIARRTRCYQEQPKIAKERRIVLPEEHLMPFYAQSVSSLLYNMTGWTQPEACKLSLLVVSIVHAWMPTVVAHTPTPQEEPENQPISAAAMPASQAKRPPVPVAPRPNAPQPVAAA